MGLQEFLCSRAFRIIQVWINQLLLYSAPRRLKSSVLWSNNIGLCEEGADTVCSNASAEKIGNCVTATSQQYIHFRHVYGSIKPDPTVTVKKGTQTLLKKRGKMCITLQIIKMLFFVLSVKFSYGTTGMRTWCAACA